MGNPHGIQTLDELPRALAAAHGDALALRFGQRETSFRDLNRAASQVANALIGRGVAPGDRVAVLAKDSDEIFALIFGVARASAVFLGINWRLTEAEVRFIVEDAEAQILFVGEEFHALAAAVQRGLDRPLQIISFGQHSAWPRFSALRDASSDQDPAPPRDPEAVVAQIYTSGTTGMPKGVQLANRSFFAVVRALDAAGDPWIGWSEQDVALHNVPTFHIGGLWWAITALTAGAALVVMETWVAWQALRLIESEGVTKVCMAPAMMQMLLLEPECAEADFSSLDTLVYGGSPITEPLMRRSLEVFGCRFAQIYGLTETGNTAICLRPEDHRLDRPELLRAAGRAYPGVRLKCIDAEGRSLPPGQIGEICVHSPANMLGYWRRPEATAATLVEGWVHTGDAGYIDAEGYVFICDRVKDMIIYAGENVYPAEVESVLARHPAVKEVAVIGVPDARWGERVHAVVALHDGQPLSLSALVAFARTALADFKLPGSLSFVDALPRTPAGKIKKAVLRAPFWEGHDRQVN